MKWLATAALAAVAAAHPTFDANEFSFVGKADGNAVMTFTAALPARNLDSLDRTLNVISDPDSPLYGQWLSQDEVLNTIAPEAEHREAVKAFVTSTGAKCRDWPTALRCAATVAQVEKLLQTEVSTYKHTHKNDKLIHRIAPGTSFHVPKELENKLMFMTSLVDFPTTRMRLGRVHSEEDKMMAASRSLQSTFDSAIVMEVLNDIYDLQNGRVSNSKSTGGPAEFQDDSSWALSDIQVFAQQNSIASWNASNIIGPFAPANPDTEATLDVQFFGGVSEGNPQWYFTESDWMYEWVQQLASTPSNQLPYVFSVSWGWSEANQCYVDTTGGGCANSNSTAYVQQTNVGFAAAAARGMTIIVSSGDSGAHGRTDGGCSQNATLPDFPVSSPYVLGAGATQLVNPTANPNPQTPVCKNNTVSLTCASAGTEVVCSTATGALIVSGGGFSNVASRPIWQEAAVAKYLSSGAQLPGAGNFNPNGRAYPDMSALGHNYLIVMGGSDEQVDGTSCSAPVLGGVFSNLNAQRIAAGKPVLGFVNPLVYKLLATQPEVFHDITEGNNSCTENGCVPGCTGFGAAPGFDAVTGVGTPNFGLLQKAIAAM